MAHSSDGRDKILLFRNLKWFFLYLGSGIGFAFFIPFPLSLLALVGVILTIDIIRARRNLAKVGFTEALRSLSSNKQSAPSANRVKYYCMSCGRENKKVQCDFCGSKMRMVGG